MSEEVKILSYADDIAVFCEDRESIREALNDVKFFCDCTDSRVNWSKCLGIWHGNWQNTPSIFESITWKVIPDKYLGVPLQHYRDTTEYWKQETEQLRDKTKTWGGRDFSMFTRSTVSNIFLISRVWYVLQVLFMSRVAVQKLHRVIAVFIWASTWERTSRTNLFRSVKSGGLGLVHLFLRQIVSRFVFLRDQDDRFLRTLIHVRLSHFLPDFIVTTVNGVTKRPKGYMKEVIAAVEILRVRFSMEYLSRVSRKRLYKDLVETMLPEPLYRTLYPNGPGDDVLKRVKKMPIRPSMKTFFFKLHSGTLPTNPWLREKGIFVPSVDCIICRKLETVDHIFLDCTDAVFLWDILQRTLKKDLPVTQYGIRFLPVINVGGVPYDMFMVLVLHSVWRTRMAVRNVDVNPRPAREYFIESVQYLMTAYEAQDKPEWLPCLDKLVGIKRLPF